MYGLQQLLESWIAPQSLETRIVSSQEGMVDKATIDCDCKPMNRALRDASHRVALCKKPRKDVARCRNRLDLGCHSRQRVGLTAAKSMHKELRETCGHRVALGV
jgi:hypothetical protein